MSPPVEERIVAGEVRILTRTAAYWRIGAVLLGV
jgi:hypothetical protein